MQCLPLNIVKLKNCPKSEILSQLPHTCVASSNTSLQKHLQVDFSSTSSNGPSIQNNEKDHLLLKIKSVLKESNFS